MCVTSCKSEQSLTSKETSGVGSPSPESIAALPWWYSELLTMFKSIPTMSEITERFWTCYTKDSILSLDLKETSNTRTTSSNDIFPTETVACSTQNTFPNPWEGDILRCSQMFSDDHRCFWIFSRYSIDVLLMFSRCSLDVPGMFAGFFQDVFKMLRWVLWAWWNLMIISNESMDFNDSKELDDSQLFDDPSYSMIPSYLMIKWKYGLW